MVARILKINKKSDFRKRFFLLTEEQIKKFYKRFDDGDLSGLTLKDKYGVQLSYSTEGGLAIPYEQMGLKNFGEQLHLRFYKIFNRRTLKADKYVMMFQTNCHKKIYDWSKEEFEIIKKNAEKLLQVAQELIVKIPHNIGENGNC